MNEAEKEHEFLYEFEAEVPYKLSNLGLRCNYEYDTQFVGHKEQELHEFHQDTLQGEIQINQALHLLADRIQVAASQSNKNLAKQAIAEFQVVCEEHEVLVQRQYKKEAEIQHIKSALQSKEYQKVLYLNTMHVEKSLELQRMHNLAGTVWDRCSAQLKSMVGLRTEMYSVHPLQREPKCGDLVLFGEYSEIAGRTNAVQLPGVGALFLAHSSIVSTVCYVLYGYNDGSGDVQIKAIPTRSLYEFPGH